MPPTMTAGPPVHDGEQRHQKSETPKAFDAAISATLEISSYDLAILKRHLLAQKWIPASTDEDAIEDAVFRFRRTYRSDRAYQVDYDYENIFRDNKRLTRLFDVWANEEIAEQEADIRCDLKELHEHEVQRETAKYNAVRDLFTHLAARKVHAGDLPDLTDEQATELLKTNARLRAIFTNNVKKSTAQEVKVLNQKIAEKDAEISGMLRSLA